MANQELVAYVKDARAHGESDLSLKDSLKAVGWRDEDIADAFAALQAPPPERNPEALSVPAAPQQARAPFSGGSGAGISFSRMTSEAPARETPQKKNPTKAVVIALVAFVVLAGGVGAYAYLGMPGLRIGGEKETAQPLPLADAKFLAKSFARIGEVKTVRYRLTIRDADAAAAPGGAASETMPASGGAPSFSLSLEGVFDLGGEYGYSREGRVIVDIAAEKIQDSVRVDLEGKYVGAKEASYVRINTVPHEIPMSDADLASLAGRWILLIPDLMERILVMEGTEQMSADMFRERLATLRKALQDRFAALDVLSIREVLPDEIVSGVPTYHVRFTVDKAKLQMLLAFGTKEAMNSLEEETAQALNFYAAILMGFSPSSGEMWIGKEDNLPYRIEFAAPPLFAETESRVALEILAYNDPVVVTEPEGHLTMEQAITMTGGEETLKWWHDFLRASDLYALRHAAERELASPENARVFFGQCKAGQIYRSDKGTTASDGTGWLPLKFPQTGRTVPLPKDPKNSASYAYRFACDPGKGAYEFDARLEARGMEDPGFDDGNNPLLFELGSDKTLLK